ncbi:hypothetical protein C4D60_Mb05t12460 [Musa balbisiana]|uniref:Uncharacterized protein n=1 Tax=Musa balbisiana TaxID=52838 RepID=A0A4S8JVN6_MUSBA|nr:hypothetical protein C4D60_Mb05t12460 [Musa balbisiana]
MVKISNSLIGILNFLTLLVSFPVIGIALWFRVQAATECERVLQLPLLVLGIFLFVVSVLGFVGSCFRVSVFLWIYLFVLFLLILAMFAFTMFGLIVTNKGVGQAIVGRAYKEYKLDDYSHWLQKRVRDWPTWNVIEGCLKEAKVCGQLEGAVGMKATEFYRKNLSPIQSGCCKPPSYCRFTYVNATYWTMPKSGAVAPGLDCKAWSNDQEKLCYTCNSCKGGVLATLKDGRKKVAIFNAALLVFLIITYTVGCCAYRNNKSRNHYPPYYYRGKLPSYKSTPSSLPSTLAPKPLRTERRQEQRKRGLLAAAGVPGSGRNPLPPPPFSLRSSLSPGSEAASDEVSVAELGDLEVAEP